MLEAMASPEADPATPDDNVAAAAAEQAMAAADEAFGRFDVEAMVTHLSAAVRGFTAAGLRSRAAMASARLGDVYANAMGNPTAGRAWYARARRLLADEPPCVEQGWVAVAAMGCEVDDPDELLAAADLALDRARRFGDVNLEVKALADGGLALVQSGRVADGMARLDEAMALVCGPADDLDNAAKSACSFFTACYRTADYARADTWAGLLRRRGLIGTQAGPPMFLNSHCNSVQAALLRELGRWTEAEALLEQTIAEYRTVMPLPPFHAGAALADLRIRQGRLTEAESLLLGLDFAFEALLPLARLNLARGDHDLAGAIASRALRAIAGDRVRAIELLDVLVDVELARGDVGAASRRATELAARVEGVEGLDVPVLQARAAAARARVLVAAGQRDEAIALLQDAHDLTATSPLPWLRAAILVELVRLRDAAGDAAGARADARAATALLVSLDVVVPTDDAELLARVGVGPPPARVNVSAACTARLARDGRWWDVTWGATSARMPDTKGLRYLAELVRSPGVERHALDLVDRVEGVDAGGVDRRGLGDGGDVLDATARRAYRHRVESLRSEIEELLEAGALEQAEARQDELDQLVRELARAFGMGGRARTVGSAAERARLNVTRALRAATARLAEALPGAGEALDRRLRTGIYCAYEPNDDDIRWIVQS
jgi:tetratricopeptide (TPR) repeat protein